MNFDKAATMEDFGNGVWCVTQLCRGKPRPPSADTSLVIWAFVNGMGKLISENHTGSEDVIKNMLWTFSYLSDGDQQEIEMVMSSGVTASLTKLCKNPQFHCLPLIKTFANFASGSNSQKQAVLDSGIMDYMGGFLGASSRHIRKEAHHFLSKIAQGDPRQAACIAHNSVIMKYIVAAANNEAMLIRKEALWTLIHVCTGLRPRIVQLINDGGLPPLVDILKLDSEPDLVLGALDAITAILKDGVSRPGEGYVQLLENCDGVLAIEALQDHESNEIYEKALNIVKEFLGGEEEDENLAPAIGGDGTF
ncbi:MAG: hypothetical protein SGARI_002895, partial [Bacillariaceae sp.]